MHVIDESVLAYDFSCSCHKDPDVPRNPGRFIKRSRTTSSSSGQSYDTLLAQWRYDTSGSNKTFSYSCKYSILGVTRLQLEAPVAYNRYPLDAFASATSS